jgi:recombinational DNA repair ATPase RecF
MKVERADARAFGPFRDQRLELSPRMTVVYGPNEAGKSTWHAAIHAALCGRRRGARTKADQEFAERYRPWGGDEWAVSAAVTLADGRRLEVRQKLDDPAASRVHERDTGRDVTADYVADGSPDLSVVLGLSRDTMPAIATVRQAEILRVREEAGALEAQLQAATSKAGADGTAVAAIERIKAYRSEHVGRKQRNSKRPLQAALNERAAAERALEGARRAHSEYLGLIKRAEEAEARAAAARARLYSARYVLRAAQLEERRERVRRARELLGTLPAGEPPDVDALERDEDRIHEVMTRFEERPDAPGPLEGPSAAELENELAALPAVPRGDTEVAEEVRLAYEGWRQAQADLRSHERYRPPGRPLGLGGVPEEGAETAAVEAAADLDPAELRRLAEVLEAPEPRRDESLSRELEELYRRLGTGAAPVVSVVAGAGLLVAAVVLLLRGLEPVWWIAALSAGLALLVLGLRPSSGRREGERRARALEARQASAEQAVREHAEELARAKRRLADLGLPTATRELRNRARAAEEALTGRERLAEWRARRQELERVAEQAGEALEASLTWRLAAFDGERPGLEVVYERYETECRERRELSRQASRRPGLEQRLKDRRSLEEASEKAREKGAAAGRAVLDLAASLGLVVEGEGETVTKLRERADEIERTLATWRRATRDLATLEEILAGRDLAELEREVEALSSSVGERPEAPAAIDLGVDAERTLDELRREDEAAREALANLEGRITNREEGLPSVAEAEESFALAEEEVRRVERLDRTLETTLTFLDVARERVQRDIAPHLRAALEESLATVTDGRYRRAGVDPRSLEVTVQDASGEWRPASLLSQGTAEQIYLLLRIALARHMCALGEPSPIFLDDPTVQSDIARTRAVLEVLKAASERHQIILFSQEEEVREWAAAQSDPEVVKLIVLTGP